LTLTETAESDSEEEEKEETQKKELLKRKREEIRKKEEEMLRKLEKMRLKEKQLREQEEKEMRRRQSQGKQSINRNELTGNRVTETKDPALNKEGQRSKEKNSAFEAQASLTAQKNLSRRERQLIQLLEDDEKEELEDENEEERKGAEQDQEFKTIQGHPVYVWALDKRKQDEKKEEERQRAHAIKIKGEEEEWRIRKQKEERAHRQKEEWERMHKRIEEELRTEEVKKKAEEELRQRDQSLKQRDQAWFHTMGEQMDRCEAEDRLSLKETTPPSSCKNRTSLDGPLRPTRVQVQGHKQKPAVPSRTLPPTPLSDRERRIALQRSDSSPTVSRGSLLTESPLKGKKGRQSEQRESAKRASLEEVANKASRRPFLLLRPVLFRGRGGRNRKQEGNQAPKQTKGAKRITKKKKHRKGRSVRFASLPTLTRSKIP